MSNFDKGKNTEGSRLQNRPPIETLLNPAETDEGNVINKMTEALKENKFEKFNLMFISAKDKNKNNAEFLQHLNESVITLIADRITELARSKNLESFIKTFHALGHYTPPTLDASIFQDPDIQNAIAQDIISASKTGPGVFTRQLNAWVKANAVDPIKIIKLPEIHEIAKQDITRLSTVGLPTFQERLDEWIKSGVVDREEIRLAR